MMKSNPVLHPRRERMVAPKVMEEKRSFVRPPFLDEGNLRPLREVRPDFADVADRLISKSGLGHVETYVYTSKCINAIAIRKDPSLEKHSNQIAYSDLMVSRFTEEAFAQVTGHELGHVSLFGKWLDKIHVKILQLTREMKDLVGKLEAATHVRIIGLMEIVPLEIVNNLLSRRIERKADDFGVKLVGTSKGVREKFLLMLKEAENDYAANDQEWSRKKKRDYRLEYYDISSFDRKSPIAPKNIIEKAEAIANHFVFGSHPTLASRTRRVEKIDGENSGKETPEKTQTH